MFILYIFLICLFYLIYLSKQLLLRRKGIHSNQLGKGSAKNKQLSLERILQFFSILMALTQLTSLFIVQQKNMWLFLLALFCLFFADCLFFAAVYQMKENWRAGIDETSKTDLVTTGIYAISRNPAFTGFGLLYLGSALIINHPLNWLLTGITILIFHLQIYQEERFLKQQFGKAYIQYCKTTPRYLFL